MWYNNERDSKSPGCAMHAPRRLPGFLFTACHRSLTSVVVALWMLMATPGPAKAASVIHAEGDAAIAGIAVRDLAADIEPGDRREGDGGVTAGMDRPLPGVERGLLIVGSDWRGPGVRRVRFGAVYRSLAVALVGWAQGVLANAVTTTATVTVTEPGVQTFSLHMVDAGVVVEALVIEPAPLPGRRDR